MISAAKAWSIKMKEAQQTAQKTISDVKSQRPRFFAPADREKSPFGELARVSDQGELEMIESIPLEIIPFFVTWLQETFGGEEYEVL